MKTLLSNVLTVWLASICTVHTLYFSSERNSPLTSVLLLQNPRQSPQECQIFRLHLLQRKFYDRETCHFFYLSLEYLIVVDTASSRMTRNREQQGLGSSRVEVESNASSISHKTYVLIEANSNTMRRLCNHWKMFIINLITTAGMIIFSTFALSRAMRVQNATTEAITNLELTFSLSEIAKFLQRERGISTMVLANENVTLATISKLAVHRKNIDKIVNFINWDLNDIKLHNDEWKVDDMIYSLKQHRSKVDNRTIELEYNLEYYTKLTTSLIKYITNSVTMNSDSLIQRSIDASNAILALTDDVGIQRALGSTFFTGCGWPTIHIRNNFLHLHGRSSAYLEVAIGYNEKVETQYIHAINSSSSVSDFIDRYLTYELFIGYVTSCKSLSKIQKEAEGLKWFQNMTVYIDIYFEIREKMNKAIKHALDDLHEKAQHKFFMYFTTLLLVVIISCIMALWYTYNIANLTGNLVEYIKKEKQISTELVKAKKKSEHILFQMVPKKIAKDLELGRPLSAEHFNDVTIYFSNICGFTEIRSKSKPMQIISTLNDICRLVF